MYVWTHTHTLQRTLAYKPSRVTDADVSQIFPRELRVEKVKLKF